METTEFEGVISSYDISKLPISITTTDVNLTGSWKFFRPVFREKLSPCSLACPSNINISKYIMQLVKGDLKAALDTIRKENPLPATCGRVCPHFCQYECNRIHYDESVAIKEIEKFLGDYGLDIPFPQPKQNKNKSVAIIGSGPAGLSCAYFLRQHGLNVTIFEKQSKLGGLLRYGIPEYRLPKEIVDKEIKNIIDTGIKVEVNQEITIDAIGKLKENFDAVFVATGLWEANILENFPIDNKYFFKGLDILKEINKNKTILKNKKIAIIGGGNVAIDVARSLKRHENDITIIYRRTIKEMPAFEEEIIDAIEEQIKIIEKSVITDYKIKDKQVFVKVSTVKNIKNKAVETDSKNIEENFDCIIFAIGQKAEIKIAEENKIFIGGDLLLGAATVTEAIASGKRKAYEITNFLGITDVKFNENNFFRSFKDYESCDVVNFERINTFYFPKFEQLKPEKLKIKERIKNFKEIYKSHSLEEIVNEAKRCFNCGICNKCGTCWFFCPDLSVVYNKEKEENINFDYEHCKGCGVCSAECPRGVIDMEEDK